MADLRRGMALDGKGDEDSVVIFPCMLISSRIRGRCWIGELNLEWTIRLSLMILSTKRVGRH